jgi:oligoribonuclease NrnB/cAMP/cGMP phosphodiesterase (DHH superfamily)
VKRYKPGPKTALVTHRGCLDGTGSALMFLWAGGKRENILFRNPSQCDLTAEEAAPYDEVWFADLCPSQMRDPAGGKPFHVFDHHASNAKKFVEDVNCTFSMVHSGTSLLGEMTGVYDSEWLSLKFVDYEDPDYYKTVRASLVSALEAYDLGKFDDQDGMFLADLASSYTQEEMLDLLKEKGWDVFSDSRQLGRVAALESMRKIYADSATKVVLTKHYEGLRVGVAASPVYWKNEVATRILQQAFDLAMVVDTAGGMVSLRSNYPDGPDCSIIASRFGGGGHPRAAGFKLGSAVMLDALFREALG